MSEQRRNLFMRLWKRKQGQSLFLRMLRWEQEIYLFMM